MLRVAHVSDLHVLSPAGFELRRTLFNKRITGHLNLLLRRGRVHRREFLAAVLDAAAAEADQLIVTGDVTNLALESEFEEAKRFLGAISRRVEVTVVPGNHDIYLPPVLRDRRFPHHFGEYLTSDLPELAVDLPAGAFPCVKLRGPLAIIALSSAVPRPPFVAAGYLGDRQLAALQRVLAHPEVRRRMPVLAVHHPPVDSRKRSSQLRDGLVDAASLRQVLMPLERGIVLFGHLHRRVRCTLRTAAGTVEVIGAGGAALDHDSPSVRAGFNLYEFDDSGRLATAEGRVLGEAGSAFQRTAIAARATVI